jgi:hypothetical protein
LLGRVVVLDLAAWCAEKTNALYNSAEAPKSIVPRKYVKRGAVYRRAKQVQLRIGEPLFVKEFGKFVEIGKVKG